MKEATVMVVLRSGGVYDARYIRALRRGLDIHAPHISLTVLTDIDAGEAHAAGAATVVKLEYAWPKWWCLVEWFKPGLFPGRVIAMGLDSLITGPLDDLANWPGRFAMISDFCVPKVLASGVMLWDGATAGPLYESFLRSGPSRVMRSFPRMDPWLRVATNHVGLAPVTRIQDVLPGRVCSYKAHARRGVPAGVSIVCGHGRPQFSEPVAGWAHEMWTERSRR